MRTKKWMWVIAAGALWVAGSSRAENLFETIRNGGELRDANVEQRDERGNTALMHAVISGNIHSVQRFIDAGADVNAANAGGTTVLMLAVGDEAKAKILLERGANVNARSGLGNTALILAARRHGSSKIVEWLLQRGAEVNATNVFGVTALMTAAASGDSRTARMLIEQGADVNAHLRGSLDNAVWGGGRSALMWASLRGDLPMMRLLLKHGARVNEQEGFGTALTQAAWMDRVEAARLLLKEGADVHAKEFFSGFTALHWAAQSEHGDDALTRLLLKNGADPNAAGGEPVDAYMGVVQTPMMLAQKRGETDLVQALAEAGGKRVQTKEKEEFRREVEAGFDPELVKLAMDRALPGLAATAVRSKGAFLNHASKQNCVSCHQQYAPLMAFGFAKTTGRGVDESAEKQVLEMVRQDNRNLYSLTAEAAFHPDPAHSYGYALLALAAQDEPASPETDAIVHHLLAIQGKDGQWFNNLPRAPIQSSDVSATALAVHGLRFYGPPARKGEIAASILRARSWLRSVRAKNTEERVYQLLGLVWAGEDAAALRVLAAKLRREQRTDGGWAQLPKLESDAYATGQALHALKVAGVRSSAKDFRQGIRFLLETQQDDGSWLVQRRAFPFQPTMNSGYAHGRDSWISASGASWAVIALAGWLEDEKVKLSAAR